MTINGRQQHQMAKEEDQIMSMKQAERNNGNPRHERQEHSKNFPSPVDPEHGDEDDTTNLHLLTPTFYTKSFHFGIFFFCAIIPLYEAIIDSLNGFGTNTNWILIMMTFCGCCIGQLVARQLCDRYGDGWTIVGVLITTVIGASLSGFFHTSWAYHVIRFCVGWVGIVIVFRHGLATCIVVKEVPGTTTAMVLGSGFIGTGVAYVAVGSGLLPLLTYIVGMSDEQAWSSVSYLLSFIAIVIAMCISDKKDRQKIAKELTRLHHQKR